MLPAERAALICDGHMTGTCGISPPNETCIAQIKHDVESALSTQQTELDRLRETQAALVAAIEAVVTPENVALGHTWLKRKIRAAIATAGAA